MASSLSLNNKYWEAKNKSLSEKIHSVQLESHQQFCSRKWGEPPKNKPR